MRSPTKDQFRGAILGLAVGDAMGFPVEFMSREDMAEQFGGPVTEIGQGLYSDDTQMTIAVADALLAEHNLMEDMAHNFVAWSVSPENDRAPGRSCMAGCKALASGVPWQQAGAIDAKGCGSAMRVAPIALRYWDDETALLTVAAQSSMLTHRHPVAIESAQVAALLVARALQGDTPREMQLRALEIVQEKELARAIRKVRYFAATQPPQLALTKGCIGEGWVAHEAVASALYCYWKSPSDFRQTIITAINTDGDSDSIGCIAGGIAGAALGVGAIPEEWLAGLENRDGLTKLADALFEASC